MLTMFNSESLWTGFDLKRLDEIRDLLSLNKIKYKYTTKNRMGQWTGHGTLRSQFGSAGTDNEYACMYEVFVSKKDHAKAKHIIG